jgi:alpha-tubulin suppressor-like RCC1 family protein
LVLASCTACVETGEVLTPIETSPSPATEPAVESDPNEPAAIPEAVEGPAPVAEPNPKDEPATPQPAEAGVAMAGAGAAAVAAGHTHSCAIQRGALYCWGSNSSGQLGVGGAADQDVPTRVGSDSNWTMVQAARAHTCAVSSAGEVFCWGGNQRGQLGQGDRQSRATPVAVELPAAATVLSADFEHSCALLETTELYCWGYNFEGGLGQGDRFPNNDDTAADGLLPLRVPGAWSHVDTGGGHTCGVKTDGTLWCWGRNSDSEIGRAEPAQVREPVQVENATDWATSAAGQSHTCALKQDGSLWCWGANSGADTNEGAPLGLPTAVVFDRPTRIGDTDDWNGLSSDTFHSCALQQSELWCWGRNVEGQLGLGDTALRDAPTLVGRGYAAVSVARFHTCALTDLGEVRCTGENTAGKLGTGAQERRREFTAVTLD